MSEEEQRTLCIDFPPLAVEVEGEDLVISWGNARPIGNGAFIQEQDIDLSGYALQRKTFYPYTSFEQRGGIVNAGFIPILSEQPYLTEVTIISSVPLTDNDLTASIAMMPGFTGFSSTASFPVNGFDRSTIIHGEFKWYTVDNSMSVPGGNNILKLLSKGVCSSLEPTAADRLYGYRYLLFAAQEGEFTGGQFPPVRILMPGNISSEPKLEYMMRLKRSYELAEGRV